MPDPKAPHCDECRRLTVERDVLRAALSNAIGHAAGGNRPQAATLTYWQAARRETGRGGSYEGAPPLEPKR